MDWPPEDVDPLAGSKRDERAALAESLGPISPEDALESGEELAFARKGTSQGFLRGCRARRLGCVRIVHGKGLGSRNREPVLKRKIQHWLRLREEVLAFSQAPAAHGGAGAVLVLLKT